MRWLAVLVVGGCGRIGFDTGAGASCDDPAPVILPADSDPIALAAGEIDNDGRADLAAVSPTGGTLVYWTSEPERRFTRHGPMLAGAGSRNVAIGTIGKGVPVIAVSNRAGGDLSVFRVSVMGEVGPAEQHVVGGAPTQIVVVDLDKDFSSDLVVGDAASTELAWLRATSDGTLTPMKLASPVTTTSAIAVADLNGNAYYDIVILDAMGQLARLHDPLTPMATGFAQGTLTGASTLVVAYVNFDGAVDAIAATDTQFMFLAGKATSFIPVDTYPLAAGPARMAAADLDGDANAELIVPYPTLDTLGIWTSTRGATFSSELLLPLAAGAAPSAVAYADFDGDGAKELAVAEPGLQRVEILFGTCPTSPSP